MLKELDLEIKHVHCAKIVSTSPLQITVQALIEDGLLKDVYK